MKPHQTPELAEGKAGTTTLSLGASFSHSTDPARGLPRSRDCGVDLGSEVYRMLREPAEPLTAEPKQSGSFRYLQGMLEAGEGGKTPANLPHLPFHSLSCLELLHPLSLCPHALPPSHLPLPCLLPAFPHPSMQL